MRAWLLTIMFVLGAAWMLTEALALTSPHLSTRQRWLVVFWLTATAGALDLAWRAGA